MTNKESAELFRQEWLDGKSTFTIKTSGSTGAPKTIELHRDQMIASAMKTIKALGLKKGMTSLVCLDVNFIAGKMMIVRSMVAEMNMIVVEPKADPFEDLPDTKIDFAAMVPYQLDHLIKSPSKIRLESIGRIILGGAPINNRLMTEIGSLHVPIYATFGMTETLSHIALEKLNGNDKQDLFEVLDGIDISLDSRSCLVIKADYLDHTIVTNDVVDLVGTKGFRWLGRWDNVINSGGIKIFPEKIEKQVGKYLLANGIDNIFFVAGVPHEQLGQQAILVIEGKLLNEIEKELLDELKKTPDQYEIPKQVLYVEKFTMTQTGKVNRSASLLNALPRLSS